MEISPSFSPDGNQVVFSWNGEAEDNFDIYIKSIGPGEPARLTSHAGGDYSPSWSPDGQYIAFWREIDARRIGLFLIPPSGGVERLLVEGYGLTMMQRALFYAPAAWSPDGEWLVFPYRTSAQGRYRLFLVSRSTGEKRRVTSAPETSPTERSPCFSPDGRTLA